MTGRPAGILLALMLCHGCNTAGETTASLPPPDAKRIILANKARIWKDPESIRGASIAAPTRHQFMSLWHVCVRLNAKNAFGGYTGEKDNLVAVYDSGEPPNVLDESGAAMLSCASAQYEPFPELNGDYRPAAAQAKGKR
jgi:hypothetical protein